ncbi:anti-sigma factor antagonist [Umezawaea beigongshangensis]|uniref:anti-sigma factor antagonist n=1 Tax=Umezawaea beigongshangensis TaxID=2780383 RepID=UPI0018F1C7BE|nr:anti-sigma factor antagonist [Umezawaea beigongshangensis]
MTVQDPDVVSTSGATTPAEVDPVGANARAEQTIDVVVDDRGDGVSVVSVGGEIDMVSAPELRSAVRAQLDGSTVLVLDMTRVRFLGSAGLAVLVEALQQSEHRGTAFSVVAEDRAVTRPLIATGLGDVFSVFPTVDEALAAQR